MVAAVAAVAAVASGSVASGASSGSGIAALQKQLTGLMKTLLEASRDTSKGAKERIKLLQMQIQGVQAQIQLLVSAAAQKAALAQLDSLQHGKHGQSAPERTQVHAATVGTVIDTTA